VYESKFFGSPRLGGEGLKAIGGLAINLIFAAPTNPPLPRPSGELQKEWSLKSRLRTDILPAYEEK